MHKIVAVQDTDPSTSRDIESPVAGGRSTTVHARFDEPNSVVFRDETLDDLNTRIGGCIVGNYNFYVTKALITCRANCIGDEFLAVIVCDNNTNIDFQPSVVIPFGH